MSNLFLVLFLISLVSLIIGFLRPSSFSIFFKKATRRNSVIIFGASVVIFFILFGITIKSTSPKGTQNNNINNQKQEQKINSKKETIQISPVAYNIVKIENVSVKALGNKSLSSYTTQELANMPIDKRIVYKIVVSPKIKENQVKPTVDKIISDITSKDNDIDEISLLLYSDKKLINGAYDVAMATWAPNGESGNVTPGIALNNIRSNYKITIQIKKNLEEYLQKQGESVSKFGFSETQRHEIFKELSVAENRAEVEANKMYPVDISNPNYRQGNIMKNLDENQKLTNKYKAEVRNKYGITKDVVGEIVTEGVTENWLTK